jgi:glucosamine--fructose-6-phosphate aminotransferase (isomerizing)
MALLVEQGRLMPADAAHYVDMLNDVPQRLAITDAMAGPAAASAAEWLAQSNGAIYISRGAATPYALEGALKLKELSYQWADALPAGELKHGPLALIESGTPVVAVMPSGDAKASEKMRSNISEVMARGAQVLIVGDESGANLPVALPQFSAPWGPIESVVALQHLARQAARCLGHNVDRPRNLAKSVTVE